MPGFEDFLVENFGAETWRLGDVLDGENGFFFAAAKYAAFGRNDESPGGSAGWVAWITSEWPTIRPELGKLPTSRLNERICLLAPVENHFP